jgi:hypothetical protein
MAGKKARRSQEETRPGREGRQMPEPDRESELTREMREREQDMGREERGRGAPRPVRREESADIGVSEELGSERLARRRELTGSDIAEANEPASGRSPTTSDER